MFMGAGAASLSALHWDLEQQLPPPDLDFPQGFDQMVRHLERGVDIEHGARVHLVSSTHKEVSISVGAGERRFAACVVTVPLGVLQQNDLLFEPALSAKRLSALNRLGMGVLAKIALQFPEPFWPKDVTHLGLLDSLAPCPGFVNLATDGTPILVGFAGGAQGRALERLGDEEALALVLGSLRRAFGASVPEAAGWIRTSWASDPFARGTYSHVPVGASGEEYDVLAAPMGQVGDETDAPLFFAGEHTHRAYPSTAHGALLSGHRAAEEVITFLSR